MYDINFYQINRRGGLTLILTFFTIVFTLHAQQTQIDSLQTLISNSPGIKKYDPLISLVRVHASSDYSEALKYAEEARVLAYDFGDSTRIVNASRIVGQLLNRLGRSKEAEQILIETLPIAKRNNVGNEYLNILSVLAVAYTFQAKYDQALDINFQALVLREAEKNNTEVSILLNNIGLAYFKLKNYKKALEFYSRSLKLKNEMRDHYDLDRLLINIGLTYNQFPDFEKAQEFFDRAFVECGDHCSEPIKVEGQFGLGASLYGRGRYEESRSHFNESYSIAKKMANKRFQAENLIYLARLNIRDQNLDSAVAFLTECEQISREVNLNEVLFQAYREYAVVYNQLKDYEKSSHYQSLYINLRDSIFNERLIENIAKVQTDYAERENLATIAAKEEVIKRQHSLNIAIAIITVLALLLIFVLFRSNRVKKKVNQALSEAKAIIEAQNKQLLNSNYNLDKELKEKNTELEKANESLQRVNEELDNFIYKTSHDIRGPLASLKGMCNVAIMDVKDELALNYLHKLDITAEKLNTILTRLLIVNQINNSTLGSERIDFVSIVNDVLLLERKKGLPPRLQIKKHIDESIEFYSDKEFVRIILENLIDNAIKFYNDSDRIDPFVDISVAEESDIIKIKVIDNGIGISQVHPEKIFQMFSRASERSETGGIGLYITKTATEKLGGAVHLKTTPEGYTEFFVTLPLSPVRVLV